VLSKYNHKYQKAWTEKKKIRKELSVKNKSAGHILFIISL